MVWSMPPTTARTAKHKLLDSIMAERAGSDLATYVTGQRAAGQSWRKIAAAVAGITGEDITDMTLIDWFQDKPEGGAA